MKTAKICTPITISTLIGAILLGGSLLSFFMVYGNENTENFITTTTQKIEDIFTKSQENHKHDIELFNKALHYEDFGTCDQISDEAKKSECHNQVTIAKAKTEKNILLCENINDENLQTNCRENILEKSAIEKNNKNICNAIITEENRLRCRESIDANKLQEILKNQNANEIQCKELEGNFAKECLRSIESYKIEEQYSLALKNHNLAQCDSISEPNLRQNCRDTILSETAQNTLNSEICNTLTSIEKRNECHKNIVLKKDIHTFEEATKNNSLVQCNLISDSKIANHCHDIIILSLAKNTSNTGLCHSLKNKENEKICLQIKNLELGNQ